MKVKGLIISIAAGTALIVGTAYGIGMGMKKKAQPVEVVSVPSVNEASMGGMGASSTLYGTIISKDTQSVELDTSHTIRKVYVKQGDKVKKGDKLMTYDMDLDKLKREAQDLTRQGLRCRAADSRLTTGAGMNISFSTGLIHRIQMKTMTALMWKTKTVR